MKDHGQHIRYFLFSQYLADGVRTTLEIILPVIIFARFGKMDMGFSLALGALCVSISDAPGPVEHKRNGMLYCNLFVFIMALITGFVNGNTILMGLLILVSTFFFTMFSVYGNRAASVGTAALLVMIFRLGDIMSPMALVQDSLLILAGGIWYMLVALVFFRFTPYRPAQRSLGECIHETAKFLRIKASLYDVNSNFEAEYRKLVAQQIVVNEKQDAVRELLYKNRELTKESTTSGKILILTFSDLMDLYEQITATWYNYESLRVRFAGTGILQDVSAVINKIAGEMDNIGLAIQSNSVYKKQYELIPELDKLKAKIDALPDKQQSKLVLKKILVNLRNLGERVDELLNYFLTGTHIKRKLYSNTEYARFVSHQQIDLSLFRNNMHLESSVFRHSLRMMLTCVAGFVITKFISYGHHSYWVLLTTIVILKPGFGLTKQRNIERLIGTIAGGILGALILIFIQDRNILFAFIVFFMLGTYTYQRLNYQVMVIFTTPYVIILFNLLGMGSWNIVQERLLDTGIACILAFMANYFLFPHWESRQFSNYMLSALKANIDYLVKIRDMPAGIKVPPIEYKLVRKQLYVSIANLSAAFHRMLSEPKSKQQDSKKVYNFVVLNNVLSSNVASLSSGLNDNPSSSWPKENLQQLQRSIKILENSLQKLDPAYQPVSAENIYANTAAGLRSDKHLTEQLDFIHKVSVDIGKISYEIV
ncbi:MAG: FUSC family membrane protein [Ferruginibacter sp.]